MPAWPKPSQMKAETQDYIKGPSLASGHARHTGHIVTAERTRFVIFGNPDRRPEYDQPEKYG